MRKNLEINHNVIYVKGANRGALYNFNKKKVYSINKTACEILEQYIKNSNFTHSYINLLKDNGFLDENFKIKEFVVQKLQPSIDFVWLEITQSCNCKCIHCYEGDWHKPSNDDLNLENWKNIILELKDLKCKNIEFIGGEPLAHPHFMELLKYSVDIGHNVHIYSNLTLFNNEILKYIKKHNITINCSIYADNKVLHDNITRKKGSFDKTIYWIKKLTENDIKVNINAIGMYNNQDNIDKINDYLSNINVPKLKKFDIIRDNNSRKSLSLAPNNHILKYAQRTKPNFSITLEKFKKASYANTCFFGKFAISSNGDILPCVFKRDYTYGNIKHQNLNSILQQEALKKYWYFDYSKVNECKDCEYRFACKDCRLLSKTKNLMSKNQRCNYNPYTGLWNN